jgi:membrane protease YdiL (CAAX protease family)
MTLSPSLDTSSQPPGVPIHIGVIVVVGYLLLHMIHGRMVYGAYVFVIERIVFLAFTLPCLMLVLRIPLRDLIGTFQLPKRKDFRFFLVSLALVVVFRMTIQIGTNWIVPGADSAVLSMQRLLDECVVAPLNEEPVFRGLVLLCLLPVFDRQRWQLLILSAVIFTACHNTNHVVNLTATTILGAILAAFFLRTKSLSGSVVLHAVWNAGIFIDPQKL